MKVKVLVHEADEGGYWADVPSIPGALLKASLFEELLENLYEAIKGCLSVDVSNVKIGKKDRLLKIAI